MPARRARGAGATPPDVLPFRGRNSDGWGHQRTSAPPGTSSTGGGTGAMTRATGWTPLPHALRARPPLRRRLTPPTARRWLARQARLRRAWVAVIEPRRRLRRCGGTGHHASRARRPFPRMYDRCAVTQGRALRARSSPGPFGLRLADVTLRDGSITCRRITPRTTNPRSTAARSEAPPLTQ